MSSLIDGATQISCSVTSASELQGRGLLVKAGHYRYQNTPYRAYLRSPQASNVLVMPGVPFSAAAPTYLTRQVIGPGGQFFEFTDTAFGGNPRDRSVYVCPHPDLVLVLDRASAPPATSSYGNGRDRDHGERFLRGRHRTGRAVIDSSPVRALKGGPKPGRARPAVPGPAPSTT